MGADAGPCGDAVCGISPNPDSGPVCLGVCIDAGNDGATDDGATCGINGLCAFGPEASTDGGADP